MPKTFEKYMTTRQLARLWMVSEASVKRWADAGLLRASRTAGGHRRFLIEDVSRFQSERGLGAPPSLFRAGERGVKVAAAAARSDASVESFYEALTSGDEDAATWLLLDSYLEGKDVWVLFDDVVAGAMRRVGDCWHDGVLTIAEEHHATRTATRALERVGVSVRRREGTGKIALCCAPEDELHELPALCLQVLLESEGWRVKNYGGNTPFFTLADAIEKQSPRLVCISSTVLTNLERCAREFAEVRAKAEACGARIALGGEGFRDENARRRFKTDLYAEKFADLREFIREEK